jgi:integrase
MPYKRAGSNNWQIRVNGVPRSSGTSDLASATALENKLNHQAWMHEKMGVLPPRSWREAVVQRAREASGNKSWKDEQRVLRWWDQHLGKVEDLNLITRNRIDDIIQKHRPVTPTEACSQNNTANKYALAVSVVLHDAERKWGWGNRAPMLRLYPILPPKDICPTPAEVMKLVAELPEHSSDIALYAVATMHRRANVTGLQWSQVDWEKRAVKIAGQFTKTGQPIYVPLNHTAMGVLERRKKARDSLVVRSINDPVRAHVFHYRGKPIEGVTTKAWKAAVRRAGLPEGVTLHTMRHCANSWLAERGVPREIRARLGGWSVGTDAIDGYTHLHIEPLRQYVAMLDPLLATVSAQTNGLDVVQLPVSA